jgi:hypothetical protein
MAQHGMIQLAGIQHSVIQPSVIQPSVTQYGTWVSYSGAARIWLAAGLLAAATGVAVAGTRLPLPRPGWTARPAPATVAGLLLAWLAAGVAFLACVSVYVQHYVAAYPGRTTPVNHIAPVTFLSAVAVFVIVLIVTRRSLSAGPRLASAAIAAIAAPMIFELPFDLIIMARTYPAIPPHPAAYRALFFVPLFLIEITTLLLLRLAPTVRLTRATFFSLALMLGVFAVWAGFGFGYPSTLAPTTLNIASKILAFVTVLTLFVSRRPARAPGRDEPGRGELATGELATGELATEQPNRREA